MENDTLVAVPLFLFMGYVVERANIVSRLFYTLQMAARNLPGSMAIAALITCTVFSTASGIVGAVVTLMGLLAFPAMAAARYNREFASGVICAGGTLGILIPPSIMLIVYSAIAELSPLRLYAAAMFPGCFWPVFTSSMSLFAFTSSHGWRQSHAKRMCRLRRRFTGTWWYPSCRSPF